MESLWKRTHAYTRLRLKVTNELNACLSCRVRALSKQEKTYPTVRTSTKSYDQKLQRKFLLCKLGLAAVRLGKCQSLRNQLEHKNATQIKPCESFKEKFSRMADASYTKEQHSTSERGTPEIQQTIWGNKPPNDDGEDQEDDECFKEHRRSFYWPQVLV